MNEKELFLASIKAAEKKHEETWHIEEQRKKDVAALEAYLKKLETQLDEVVAIAEEQSEPEPTVIVEEAAPVITEEPEAIPLGAQPLPQLATKTMVTKSVELLAKLPRNKFEDEVAATPETLRKEIDIIKKTITDLHRFARNASQMGGGGEVNLRYMDDIDTRPTIANNMFLRYSTDKNKFEYANVTLALDWAHVPANVIPRELGHNLGNSTFYWNTTHTANVAFTDGTYQNTAYYDDFIEVYDRSANLVINSTPQILAPPTIGPANNITYSNGVFTFPNPGKFALSLALNAQADVAVAKLYVYAERNTGSGWAPNQNSGKEFTLVNNQRAQIVYSQAVHRAAGEQTRYWIYSDDADSKVTLKTTTLPTISNTVYTPAIRIQFA